MIYNISYISWLLLYQPFPMHSKASQPMGSRLWWRESAAQAQPSAVGGEWFKICSLLNLLWSVEKEGMLCRSGAIVGSPSSDGGTRTGSEMCKDWEVIWWLICFVSAPTQKQFIFDVTYLISLHNYWVWHQLWMISFINLHQKWFFRQKHFTW